MHLTSADVRAAREGFHFVVMRGGTRVAYTTTAAEAKREGGKGCKVYALGQMRYTSQNPASKRAQLASLDRRIKAAERAGMPVAYLLEQRDLLTRRKKANPSFARWLDTFLEEKEIDLEEVLEVKGKQWGTNYIPVGVLVQAMKRAPKHEQEAIKTMLVKIDFRNAPVRPYLAHLGQAIARNPRRNPSCPCGVNRCSNSDPLWEYEVVTRDGKSRKIRKHAKDLQDAEFMAKFVLPHTPDRFKSVTVAGGPFASQAKSEASIEGSFPVVTTIHKGYRIRNNETGEIYTVLGAGPKIRGTQRYVVTDSQGNEWSMRRENLLQGQKEGTVTVLDLKRNPGKSSRMRPALPNPGLSKAGKRHLIQTMHKAGADTFTKKIKYVRKHMPNVTDPAAFVGYVMQGEKR